MSTNLAYFESKIIDKWFIKIKIGHMVQSTNSLDLIPLTGFLKKKNPLTGPSLPFQEFCWPKIILSLLKAMISIHNTIWADKL